MRVLQLDPFLQTFAVGTDGSEQGKEDGDGDVWMGSWLRGWQMSKTDKDLIWTQFVWPWLVRCVCGS